MEAVNIRISTIHSVKGAEADNVILLPDITKRVFENLCLFPEVQPAAADIAEFLRPLLRLREYPERTAPVGFGFRVFEPATRTREHFRGLAGEFIVLSHYKPTFPEVVRADPGPRV